MADKIKTDGIRKETGIADLMYKGEHDLGKRGRYMIWSDPSDKSIVYGQSTSRGGSFEKISRGPRGGMKFTKIN